MHRFNFLYKHLPLLILILNYYGCGGTRTGNPAVEVNGTATLGPVSGATVTAYVLNMDGTRGVALGSATTSTSGSFKIPLDTSGPITLVMTGGSYTDEARAVLVTVPVGFELEIWAPAGPSTTSLHLHGLSTIAAARAKNLAATAGLSSAHSQSALATAGLFGLTNMDTGLIKPDIFTVSGGAPNAAASTAKLGLVISGLSQLIEDQPFPGLDPIKQLSLIQNIAHDYSDGVFDGKNSANINVPNTLPMTPKQAINNMQTAMTNFLNSAQNASGWSSSNFGSYPPPIP